MCGKANRNNCGENVMMNNKERQEQSTGSLQKESSETDKTNWGCPCCC